MDWDGHGTVSLTGPDQWIGQVWAPWFVCAQQHTGRPQGKKCGEKGEKGEERREEETRGEGQIVAPVIGCCIAGYIMAPLVGIVPTAMP